MATIRTSTQPTIVVHFRAPVEVVQQLKTIAKREDRSLSGQVCRAVRQHVEAKSVQRGST